MGKKGNFGAGLILGIAAGFAAKYLVDNKEEVKAVVGETTVKFAEGAKEFAGYAGSKLGEMGDEVAKAAGEYIDYAKEQFKDIKDTLTADFGLYTDEELDASDLEDEGEEPLETANENESDTEE